MACKHCVWIPGYLQAAGSPRIPPALRKTTWMLPFIFDKYHKANKINTVIKIITRALMEGMKCRARFIQGVLRWGLRPQPYLRSLSLRTVRPPPPWFTVGYLKEWKCTLGVKTINPPAKLFQWGGNFLMFFPPIESFIRKVSWTGSNR